MGPPNPTRGYVIVLCAAVLFGVNASVSKVVLTAGIDPPRLTALRCTGAAIGLLIVALVTRPTRLRVTWREIPSLVVLGVVGAALIQWLYFVAIERLPVGIALLLEFTAPVLVALYARLVMREPVRRRMWLALGFALGGLTLVAQVWQGGGLDLVGVIAGLGAAVCLTTYYLVGQRHIVRRDAVSLTFWMFAFASLFWAIVLPWWTFEVGALTESASLLGGLSGVSAPVWGSLLWVIVLGTLVPFALNLTALRHLPATSVGVVGMAEPVLAGIVAWWWLGQSLSPAQLIGGLVVLVGVGLAQTSRMAVRTTTRVRPVMPDVELVGR